MADWKSEYERKIREQAAEKERRENQRSEEKFQREQEKIQKQYDDRLAKHKRSFQCHVCGTVSEKPDTTYTVSRTRSDPHDPERELYDESPDWSKPGDLEKCSHCQKWTCSDCLHLGVCRFCAQKGYAPKR
jgi:hypothetical protein